MESFFSNETLAIIVPMVVFIITLFMVVKRLISFVFTLVLLAFAIVSGLAIINYDVVRDYINNDIPQERYDELKDGFYRFKQQIIEAFDELKNDLRNLDNEQPQNYGELEGRAEYLINKVEVQEARLSELIQELEHRKRNAS